ncbi:hypothetical protein SAMD00019534_067270 [Acytostelium subglobosum LB1]|uniref:hypothetical protein n=1 Tax=Acytostelium subglobosum LB1 TaxID=1410327 RepID=UPI00064482BE|nr:hypothetical protein SAMD00019534_067270 [Acytostelium subglobosum LB1]GAM23552.1 hypothetical protein SAMD00019534_067270 [Acytostelium subglobosum LB1]|eukprot:XP_012753293.1 hypothetical protein SAMD00019534_067270 [Acytostelium subglobosum LB1]
MSTNDIEYNYDFDPNVKFKDYINKGAENYKSINNRWKTTQSSSSTSSTTSSNMNTTSTSTSTTTSSVNNNNRSNVNINNNSSSSSNNSNRNNNRMDYINSDSVDAIQVIDELLHKNGLFSKRVPLPDLVSILVEEWETEEAAL